MGFIILVIIAYFLFKYFNEKKGDSNKFDKKNSALDLLNERYAKGEIDDEEYNKKKKAVKD